MEEAIFICMKSETERATEILIEVTRVFVNEKTRTDQPVEPTPPPRQGPAPEEPSRPIRRRLAGPITRKVPETYASWPHNECSLLLDELYPGRLIWERVIIMTNLVGPYHDGRLGEIVPSPSTRAADVLRFVRCPLPKPKKPKLLPKP